LPSTAKTYETINFYLELAFRLRANRYFVVSLTKSLSALTMIKKLMAKSRAHNKL
jgi:hypothetical protein